MGDDPGSEQTREQLQSQLREARTQEFEASVHANRLYETASQAEAEAAFAELEARRDDVARLERQLSDLDRPRESILDELDADSEHAAMLAGIGGGDGQTAEQAQAEANRRNRRILVGLAASGSLLAVAILSWLAWQQQPFLGTSPSPTSVAQASPSGGPSPTGHSTPALATPSPAPPTPTPLPLTERPATGSAFGVASFARTSGSCPIAAEFTAAFTLDANDGDATLTQLPINHVTSGTLTRTGPGGGLLAVAAEGQRYEATISGNTVSGSHLYTVGGCNDAYDFRMILDRPLLAPPPFGVAGAHFQFLDDEGAEMLDISVGGVVAGKFVLISEDELDLGNQLPIRVSLHQGDDVLWDLSIGRNPSTAIAIPADVLAALLSGPQPVLIATRSGDDVLAVFAPRDIDWELAWIAELLAG